MISKTVSCIVLRKSRILAERGTDGKNHIYMSCLLMVPLVEPRFDLPYIPQKGQPCRLQITNKGHRPILTCFIRLGTVMAKLKRRDWLIKLNIKLKYISPDRLINLLVRMDLIVLIIGMSPCMIDARVGISSFDLIMHFWVEKREGEYKLVVLTQKSLDLHDPCILSKY